MRKTNVYAVETGLIQGWILRSLFALGFGGLGRRGNGQNLLNGVLEFDAVQSQIFRRFSPVIVWAIVFFILLLKSAHKIYVQGIKSENPKEDEIFTIRDKPSRIAVFVVVASILAVLMLIIPVKQNSQIAQLKQQLLAAKPKPIIPPKPLPTIIIPNPENELPHSEVVSNSEAPIDVPKPFEVFDSITDAISDTGFSVAELKHKNLLKKQQEDQEKLESLKTWWLKAIPDYNYALESLNNILVKNLPAGDGMGLSPGYFTCLPTNLAEDIAGEKFAEIKYQKNTNIDFIISIQGKPTEERLLLISGSHGSLELHPVTSRNTFSRAIHFPDVDYMNETNVDFHKYIDGGLIQLIRYQNAYSNDTNN
jgi:hypothetical protein